MKKINSLLILLGIIISTSVFSQESGYDIKAKVKGINDGDTIYLANYFGKKLYYADTAYSKGDEIRFTGDSLKGGKYAVVIPGVKFFEIIVAEDEIEFETDANDFIDQMKIIKSEENKVFYDYVHYLKDKRLSVKPLEDTLNMMVGKNGPEREEIIEKLRSVNKDVEQEQQRVVDTYPNLLVAKYIYMSMPVPIADAPTDENGVITDSTYQRYYYVSHFFDHFDFTDDRIVRDAIFETKIDEFFKKVVYPLPDSINVEADKLISRTNKKDDIFKFIVHYNASMFEREKVMGMDAVFVHMVEEYYMTGMAFWADSATTSNMTERAMKLKPTLIGQRAPYLNLFDTTETKQISLYDVKADFTILYFWDSGCGHCKKVTPVIQEAYHDLEDKGVKVYAVGTELENDKWKEYIIENELDFINVSDKPDAPGYFRTIYDIFSTPRIFILDENKKIIAKQLAAEQVKDFLNFEIEKKNKK